MDWRAWCKLCGSVDAILKPDHEQEDVVRRLLELTIDDSLVCLECLNLLNTCVEFTKKSNQIQSMFDEVKSSNKDRNSINAIRMQYQLPPVPDDSADHVEVIMKMGDSEEIVHQITIINNNNDDSEEYIVEEHILNDVTDDETFEYENVQEDEVSESIEHSKKQESNYHCMSCKLNYKTLAAYQKHIELKHSEEGIKWICSTCGRNFKDKQILKNHERVHLPDDQRLKFPCSFCDKKFVTNHCLKIHIARVHEKIAYFFCETCGKGCTTKSDLLWHMDKHKATRDFECNICHLKFKSTNSLRIHKRRHEAVENTKQCPICKKEFRSNSALSTHKLVHSEEKKYKCQYCPNSYKRLEALKCHLSIHTGQRPYKCPWCTRAFVNSANCRKHKLKEHPKEVAQYEAVHGKRGVSLAIKN